MNPKLPSIAVTVPGATNIDINSKLVISDCRVPSKVGYGNNIPFDVFATKTYDALRTVYYYYYYYSTKTLKYRTKYRIFHPLKSK